MNDYIMHFGTKGQKWGVRKYQNADGTFNEAGKKRYFSHYQNKMRAKAEKYGAKHAGKHGKDASHYERKYLMKKYSKIHKGQAELGVGAVGMPVALAITASLTSTPLILATAPVSGAVMGGLYLHNKKKLSELNDLMK